MTLFSCRGGFKHYYQTETTETRFVISIHSVPQIKSAQKIEKQIRGFNGETELINKNAYISSKNIKKVEIIPNKRNNEKYDLIFYLNRRGRIQWVHMSMWNRGQKLALVVDGVLLKTFYINKIFKDPANARLVKIEGAFSKLAAETLRDYTTMNYKILNRYRKMNNISK